MPQGRRAGQNLLPVDPGPACKGAKGHRNCPTLTASFSWSFKAQTIASVPAWLLRGLFRGLLCGLLNGLVPMHTSSTHCKRPQTPVAVACPALPPSSSRLSGQVGRLSPPTPPSAVSLRQQLPLTPGLCPRCTRRARGSSTSAPACSPHGAAHLEGARLHSFPSRVWVYTRVHAGPSGRTGTVLLVSPLSMPCCCCCTQDCRSPCGSVTWAHPANVGWARSCSPRRAAVKPLVWYFERLERCQARGAVGQALLLPPSPAARTPESGPDACRPATRRYRGQSDLQPARPARLLPPCRQKVTTPVRGSESPAAHEASTL